MPKRRSSEELQSSRDTSVASSRRRPVQERSQETVQRILEAASALLARAPVDQITTHLIARKAGLSIGALYRFFPGKQAIIDSVAVRHVQDFQATLERLLAGGPPQDGPAFLEAVVDAFIQLLDARPDFQAIALGQYVSAETRRRQTDPGVGGAGVLKRFMLEALGMRGLPDLDLRLRIAIETGERLIAYAYEQSGQTRRKRIIREMKRLLSSYLFAS